MIEVGERVEARPQFKVSRLRNFLPLGMAAADALLIYAALLLAYWIRYSLEIGPQIQDRVSFGAYQPVAILMLGIMMPVLFSKGAYRSRFSTEMVDELTVIFSAATISVAAIVVITTMLERDVYSRGVILYLWLLVTAMVIAGRWLFRSVQGFFYRRGIGVRRLLVVGTTDVAKMVMQSVMSRRDLGYDLVGFVKDGAEPHQGDFGRFRSLGSVSDIPDLIENQGVQEVIVALPASAHEEVWSVLALAERHGVGLKLVPDLFEMSLSRVQVDDIAGIPLLDVQEKPSQSLARAGKRLMDLVVASAVTLLSLPILGLLGLLIRLESPGAPLILQDRVGFGGHAFKCYKLRTMRKGAEDMQATLVQMNETQGPIFKIRNDPRCTRLGKWIRRWSLDELPQIWNVVIGDMSLVGPRPPLPTEVAQYEARHMRRLEVKPGMTGIWQVSGRSELAFDEMLMMDIYYVDNWSLALDARILIRTFIAVLRRHGAY